MILGKFRTVILLCIAVTSVAQSSSKIGACLGNLKNIDLYKLVYADEHKLKIGDEINEEDLIREYIKSPRLMTCPSGGKYIIGPVGTPARCTYPSHSIEGLRKIQHDIVREHLIPSYYAISIVFPVSFLSVKVFRKYKSVKNQKLNRFPYIATFLWAYFICTCVLLVIWRNSNEPPPNWFACIFPTLTLITYPKWL